MLNKILKTIGCEKGFTILETILTTTILAAGLMGGMVVMQNAVARTANGDLNTIATQKANEKIEEILADNQFRGFDYITDGNYDGETLEEYSFSRTVNVTEVSSDDLTSAEEGSGLKKVDVTVSWGSDNANADHQQVTVSTLLSDYE